MTGADDGGLPRFALSVAFLVVVASTTGLVVDDVYRDNALVTASWRGTDLVSLVVGVPVLVASALWTRQGSARGALVCLGALAYAAYNYAFYLFGAAFNGLFLVYVSVLAFSTLGLIFGLSSERLRGIVSEVRPTRRDRRVGWLVALIALLLGIFWVGTSVGYIRTGRVPAMVDATGHPTNVTGALDLWLVVTFGLLGGAWLARGRRWGFVLSFVWAVKGALYMGALTSASVSAYRAGATQGLVELTLWVPVGAACLFGVAVLLRAVPER